MTSRAFGLRSRDEAPWPIFSFRFEVPTSTSWCQRAVFFHQLCLAAHGHDTLFSPPSLRTRYICAGPLWRKLLAVQRPLPSYDAHVTTLLRFLIYVCPPNLRISCRNCLCTYTCSPQFHLPRFPCRHFERYLLLL